MVVPAIVTTNVPAVEEPKMHEVLATPPAVRPTVLGVQPTVIPAGKPGAVMFTEPTKLLILASVIFIVPVAPELMLRGLPTDTAKSETLTVTMTE